MDMATDTDMDMDMDMDMELELATFVKYFIVPIAPYGMPLK